MPAPAQDAHATAAAVLATSGLDRLSHESAARLPGLLEAMNDLGTGPELHSTLDRIACTATRLTGCGFAAISVRDPGRQGLKHFVTYSDADSERGTDADADPGPAPGTHTDRDSAPDLARPDPGADATPHTPSTPHGPRLHYPPHDTHALLDVILHRDAPLRLPDLQAYGFPLGSPPLRSFLGVPVRVGTEPVGTVHLTAKHGGGDFTDNDILLARVLAAEAGVAIHNARQHETARQRERWIEGSVAITTSLLSGDMDDALTVVAEQVRRLADASAGIVLLPTPEQGLEIVAVSIDDPRGLIGTVIPPGSPVLEQLLNGEPVFIDDAVHDGRMVAPLGERFGPCMLLPLESGDRVIGTLAVPRATGAEPFTEAEESFATQFAAQAALALVLAGAQRDREQLAVYEDRDRIARDLHDLVVQRLFATGMTLQGARRKAVSPAAVQGIGAAIEQLDTTIAEIRTAIFALQQDPGAAQAGLRTRVLREIGLAAVPLGFQPSAQFLGAVDARVSEPTARELIAALREALSNAFRHARASRIEVTVDATAVLPEGSSGVRLTVADDGVGVRAAGRRSGLLNLKRRAEILGGTADWGPGLGPGGAGTTLTWQASL